MASPPSDPAEEDACCCKSRWCRLETMEPAGLARAVVSGESPALGPPLSPGAYPERAEEAVPNPPCCQKKKLMTACTYCAFP